MANEVDRLPALERELDELRLQMPKHSPRPSLLLRIEDLEDEIARLRALKEVD
ncbi:MAG: histidine kinase [Chloroflexota bacterium]